MNKEAIFGSGTDQWETPQEFFESLDKEFGFKTDVCATAENTKCERFFSPEQNGLLQEWTGVCWCNPPYGREIKKWVRKAAGSEATTVLLLPARTDTGWFHEHIYGKAEVRFLRGRIKFSGAKHNAPFPCMLVVFRNEKDNRARKWEDCVSRR